MNFILASMRTTKSFGNKTAQELKTSTLHIKKIKLTIQFQGDTRKTLSNALKEKNISSRCFGFFFLTFDYIASSYTCEAMKMKRGL